MRADEVGVVDIDVVDVLPRVELRLEALHYVALADNIVGDADAADLVESSRQRVRLIGMRADIFGGGLDLHAAVGLAGLDEPLHLGELFLARNRARRELLVNPFFGGSHALLGVILGDAGADHQHGEKAQRDNFIHRNPFLEIGTRI